MGRFDLRGFDWDVLTWDIFFTWDVLTLGRFDIGRFDFANFPHAFSRGGVCVISPPPY